jgi:hypothetical protein
MIRECVRQRLWWIKGLRTDERLEILNRADWRKPTFIADHGH